MPIIVHRIARNVEQGRETINRILEIDTKSGVNTFYIRQLEEAMERTRRTNETLQQLLAASQADVIELRVRQRAHERHLINWKI